MRPLKLLPAWHEQVVPTEWQVQTVLGDFMSKARVVTCQAPRCRQCALISDFLYLASLSIREEAAVTTNWIKDRPEGMKLQNLKLATMTGPVVLCGGVVFVGYQEAVQRVALHEQKWRRRVQHGLQEMTE